MSRFIAEGRIAIQFHSRYLMSGNGTAGTSPWLRLSHGPVWTSAVKIPASALGLLPIALATLSITVLSAWMPDLDVMLAERLFDPTSKTFPFASISVLELLRQQGLAIVVSVVACIGGALLMKFMLPRRPLLIPGRAIIFLALTLTIGPGLLVNVVLKPHWGRPRPVAIVQFGGHEPYVPWWKTNGTCTSNCSFVSGESSVAAWLFAPAVLIPPPSGGGRGCSGHIHHGDWLVAHGLWRTLFYRCRIRHPDDIAGHLGDVRANFPLAAHAPG